MRDILADVSPDIKTFQVNGSTIAGALVKISENSGVTMTSAGGDAFVGQAVQDKADNAKVAVLQPPTTTYVNITGGNISAGNYLMPDSDIGYATLLDGGVVTCCGLVLDFYSSTVAEVKLMNIPNVTC